mmetsp:Transcript_5555/g.14055  ORF Transcript_5555/g.14055 Transcript_5555/m.14055 type:complete len:282 (+) Transcript_5555:49-894(+)
MMMGSLSLSLLLLLLLLCEEETHIGEKIESTLQMCTDGLFRFSDERSQHRRHCFVVQLLLYGATDPVHGGLSDVAVGVAKHQQLTVTHREQETATLRSAQQLEKHQCQHAQLNAHRHCVQLYAVRARSSAERREGRQQRCGSGRGGDQETVTQQTCGQQRHNDALESELHRETMQPPLRRVGDQEKNDEDVVCAVAEQELAEIERSEARHSDQRQCGEQEHQQCTPESVAMKSVGCGRRKLRRCESRRPRRPCRRACSTEFWWKHGRGGGGIFEGCLEGCL